MCIGWLVGGSGWEPYGASLCILLNVITPSWVGCHLLSPASTMGAPNPIQSSFRPGKASILKRNHLWISPFDSCYIRPYSYSHLNALACTPLLFAKQSPFAVIYGHEQMREGSEILDTAMPCSPSPLHEGSPARRFMPRAKVTHHGSSPACFAA